LEQIRPAQAPIGQQNQFGGNRHASEHASPEQYRCFEDRLAADFNQHLQKSIRSGTSLKQWKSRGLTELGYKYHDEWDEAIMVFENGTNAASGVYYVVPIWADGTAYGYTDTWKTIERYFEVTDTHNLAKTASPCWLKISRAGLAHEDTTPAARGTLAVLPV